MSGKERFSSDQDRRQLSLRRKPQLNNLGLIAMLSLTALGLAAAAASAAKRPAGCSSTLLHESRPPACLSRSMRSSGLRSDLWMVDFRPAD
jgi:hypothetical protein